MTKRFIVTFDSDDERMNTDTIQDLMSRTIVRKYLSIVRVSTKEIISE